ncbi:MAG: Transcriptional regulator, MarR family, partial [uncultured Thermomicrobiales bacterium]
MSRKREELLRGLEEESRKSTLDGVYFFQAVAERSGMNLTDLQCVAILSSTGPITAGQLAETMRLTTGAVTGVVNRLERAGYVRREKDPTDGRRVVIEPVREELKRAGV